MTARRNKRTMWIALAAAPALMLVGCTSSGGDADSGTGDETEVRTLQLAHSYTEEQPQHACGAQVIADEVAAADVGLEIEIFPASQLGGDADRIALVASGDIDMDIQGASALGAVYEPISVLDAAYAFDDADHLAAFMASDESSVLVDGFKEASGVQVVGVWSAGERHFTSNTPIRTPEDLDGVRMRFPGSPQYLMNAEALGADATEVAYEELYLALQQGTVDAQENPITNILAQSFYEVQDYLNLSAHQLNTNLVIVSPVWDELTEEQQEALTSATETAVTSVTKCIEDEAEATLDEWRNGDDWEVIEDVDREAFQEMTVAYFEENYTGDSLEVFEAIRATAP